jgi:hypothetical protein
MAAHETHVWPVTALLTGILIGAAVVQALNAIVKSLRQRRLARAEEEESLRKRYARDGGHCSHQRDAEEDALPHGRGHGA